jgi:hypothetical protein
MLTLILETIISSTDTAGQRLNEAATELQLTITSGVSELIQHHPRHFAELQVVINSETEISYETLSLKN